MNVIERTRLYVQQRSPGFVTAHKAFTQKVHAAALLILTRIRALPKPSTWYQCAVVIGSVLFQTGPFVGVAALGVLCFGGGIKADKTPKDYEVKNPARPASPQVADKAPQEPPVPVPTVNANPEPAKKIPESPIPDIPIPEDFELENGELPDTPREKQETPSQPLPAVFKT